MRTFLASATRLVVAVTLAGTGLVALASSATAAAPTITYASLPMPPGDVSGTTPTGSTRAVACPDVGTCLVIGTAYDPHPEGSIVTWTGSTWSAVQAPLPPDNTVDSSNFHVNLAEIACAGASSCAVVGSYASTSGGSSDGREGLLLSYANGTWNAVRAPVPADHLASDDEAYLTSVACDAPGSCIAVGTYLHYVNGGPTWTEGPLMERLSGGVWTASALPLPADALPTNFQAGLSQIACGAPGSCTAVGYYFQPNASTNTGFQKWPLVETFTNGSAAATAAPLPPDVGTSSLNGGLDNVACNGSGCAAYGSYRDTSNTMQWVLEAGASGGFTPTRPSSGPNTSSASGLSDVSCGGPTNCVIVGVNTDASNHLYGVLDTLAGGTWTESTAPEPSDANTTQPYSYLTGVSCQDATDCTAVGHYTSTSTTSALIDVLSNGVWTGYSSGLGNDPALYSVGCDPTGACIAPGGTGTVILVNAPPPPPLVISPTSLSNGVRNVAYSAQLTATGGGARPDTFSLVSGSLPAGLTLSSSGAISGTPTTPGTSTFTVRVADSQNPVDTATATLSLTIVPVEVTPTTLPGAPIDAAYKTTLGAIGGTGPYTWKLMSGTLPKGLTLASTGVVSGTPTVLGTSTFTVQVTDATTPAHGVATAVVSLTVVPMTVATTTLPNAPIGRSYKATLTTHGGKATLHWKVSSGTLPAGLTLSTAGIISGTPSAVGTSSFTVKVTDSEVPAESATANESITVTPMAITTASLPNGVAHKAYSAKLTVSGGKGILTFSKVGTLPPGIAMSSGGVFSGTPTTPGTYSFTVAVHDSSTPKNTASKAFTITVT